MDKNRFNKVLNLTSKNSLKLTCEHICQKFSGASPWTPIQREGGRRRERRGREGREEREASPNKILRLQHENVQAIYRACL
jgi:hypothetical protein